jgi:predicted ATPase
MLKRLYVDNYKCLVNFEVHLSELTLLLGPNGVGKSSILDIVFALRQLLGGVAKITDAGIFPFRTLTRWQEHARQVIELDVDLDGVPMTYRLEVQHETDTRRARVELERLHSRRKPLFEFSKGEVQLYRDNHSVGPKFSADWSESALARVAPTKDNKRLTSFLGLMRKILVCGLYPAGFAAESATEDALLHRDGSNFVAWYRHAFQERQDLVPTYHEALKGVLEGFSGIRLEKVGQDTRAFLTVFQRDGKDYPPLRLDELSDGQRALIALYALVHITAGQGYTLFLDEPDNYVALPEIQPWLMALKDACGETVPQAVICSHHPELIDYLGPEHGLLFARESSGAVVARPLNTDSMEGGLKLSEVVARGWER